MVLVWFESAWHVLNCWILATIFDLFFVLQLSICLHWMFLMPTTNWILLCPCVDGSWLAVAKWSYGCNKLQVVRQEWQHRRWAWVGIFEEINNAQWKSGNGCIVVPSGIWVVAFGLSLTVTVTLVTLFFVSITPRI